MWFWKWDSFLAPKGSTAFICRHSPLPRVPVVFIGGKVSWHMLALPCGLTYAGTCL